MKLKKYVGILILGLFLASIQLCAADISERTLNSQWNSEWISYPEGSGQDYEVLHFRKSFSLTEKLDEFIIHVSADNRYRLFVNGTPVCFGPARGDVLHWYFETVDVAEYLNIGENVISAVVWNFAEDMPVAQKSVRTAFIVQGNTTIEDIVNTNSSWKVKKNESYSPYSINHLSASYYVVGSGEKVDGNLYPWNWEQPEYNDEEWNASKALMNGNTTFVDSSQWVLLPRDIPFLEEQDVRFGKLARVSGIELDEDFIHGNTPQTIPANSKVTLLFDQQELTIAYPELIVSGGKNSIITFTYAESLVNGSEKLNRNQVGDLKIVGNNDSFIPDGGENRLYRPLWFRTYRYVQIDIETADNDLILEDLKGKFTSYPFVENASFESDNALLENIWDAGWRTARLCAFETYYDCPYYEQLQYIGDTRIQALISMYVSGDDRLVRKAINTFYWSRIPEGLTESRYPSNELQIIPTYSLFWISMIHDYWMLRGDSTFISTYTEGIIDILNWYKDKIDEQTKILGYVPYWNFVDWATPWGWNGSLGMGGYPPGMLEGGSSILTLQFAYTIDQALDLFEILGKEDIIPYWQDLSENLKQETYNLCFKEDKMIMADDIVSTSFSQHASIMGILTGSIPKSKQKEVMKQVLEDDELIQATLYYKFYLIRALKKTGMADLYVSQLKPWEKMLDIGLSTFAEQPEPTRSDCHAWSASPNYDFLATICGIVPASAGFKTVRIEPSLGELNHIKGKMPHPEGEISLELFKNSAGGLNGKIVLPENTEGEFVYKGMTIALNAGENLISPFPEFNKAKVDTNSSVIDIKFTHPLQAELNPEKFLLSINEVDTFLLKGIKINNLDSSNLTLLLNTKISNTDTILLSYIDSLGSIGITHPIIPFVNREVDNLLEGSAPKLKEAQTGIDGNSVILHFNKNLDIPGVAGLKLVLTSSDSMDLPITDFSFIDNDSSIVNLSIEASLSGDDVLLFSYSGTTIESKDGGILDTISAYPVLNILNPLAPRIDSAMVMKKGKGIDVYFSKNMKDAFNHLSDFQIKVQDQTVDLIRIYTKNNTVTFFPYFPIRYADEVSISYKAGDYRSIDGGALDSFSDFPVVNNLTQPVYSVPGKIEAENFEDQSGTMLDFTIDNTGDIDVVSLNTGDWLEYLVEVASDGSYSIDFRMFGNELDGEFVVQTTMDAETINDTIFIQFGTDNPSWINIVDTIQLRAGKQKIKLLINDDIDRLNSFTLKRIGNIVTAIYPDPQSNFLSFNMNVLPNPSNEIFTITGNNKNICTVQFYNSLGVNIYQVTLNPNSKKQINSNFWPAGVYFMRAVDGNKSIVKQLQVYH